jgi:hypothetical protein
MNGRRIAAMMIAAVISVTAMGPAAKAMTADIGSACGAYFAAQAQQLATLPGGAAVTRWLTTQIRSDTVLIDLLVFKPNGVLRFTGFGCSIGKGGKLAPIGVGASRAPGGSPTGQ